MKILTLLLFCITFITPVIASEINIQKLTGVWGNSEDGGKTIWGYEHYFDDGRIKSWGIIPQTPIKYEIESTFKVKQKFKVSSCVTITKTTHPEITPIGESWCDEIIELNDKIFTFKSSDGEVATLYRQDL